MPDSDQMHERDCKRKQDSDSKKQTENHQDRAGAAENRADESPKFVMRMKIEMPHRRTEMLPTVCSAPQNRRN